MTKELIELKEEMRKIAGQWDGDNPGQLEDRAIIAQNIVDKIDMIALMEKKIKELQKELKEV